MSDSMWFVSDIISDIESIQLRICTMIKHLDPQIPERDNLIGTVGKLERALEILEKTQPPDKGRS